MQWMRYIIKGHFIDGHINWNFLEMGFKRRSWNNTIYKNWRKRPWTSSQSTCILTWRHAFYYLMCEKANFIMGINEIGISKVTMLQISLTLVFLTGSLLWLSWPAIRDKGPVLVSPIIGMATGASSFSLSSSFPPPPSASSSSVKCQILALWLAK